MGWGAPLLPRRARTNRTHTFRAFYTFVAGARIEMAFRMRPAMDAERVPGEEPNRNTTATLQGIRALPSLAALSTAGVRCEVAARLSTEVEVSHSLSCVSNMVSKPEWSVEGAGEGVDPEDAVH